MDAEIVHFDALRTVWRGLERRRVDVGARNTLACEERWKCWRSRHRLVAAVLAFASTAGSRSAEYSSAGWLAGERHHQLNEPASASSNRSYSTHSHHGRTIGSVRHGSRKKAFTFHAPCKSQKCTAASSATDSSEAAALSQSRACSTRRDTWKIRATWTSASIGF